jgi:hypothetical protein
MRTPQNVLEVFNRNPLDANALMARCFTSHNPDVAQRNPQLSGDDSPEIFIRGTIDRR